MTPTQLARAWYLDALTPPNLDLIAELLAPDAVVVYAFGPRLRGHEGAHAYVGSVHDSFSDLRMEVLREAEVGDVAYLDVRVRSRHTSHFIGVEASGKEMDVVVFARVEARDGQIVSIHESTDVPSLRAALAGNDKPTPLPAPTEVPRLVATLRSTNWDVSRRFFHRLGFEVTFEWRHAPGFPVYAGLFGHGVVLHVSEHSGDCEPGSLIRVRVEDVDAVREVAVEAGVEMAPPISQPWQNREATVRDPDGNRILFFTPIVP